VPGRSVAGPALLDDSTSTLLLPEGWRAERDAADNLILTRETRDA
jgi:N-methylhydantoinase A/oxoprolinase/acetone carboxylase beta subunit